MTKETDFAPELLLHKGYYDKIIRKPGRLFTENSHNRAILHSRTHDERPKRDHGRPFFDKDVSVPFGEADRQHGEGDGRSKLMSKLPTDQHITYQLQYRKCGKPTCGTCKNGAGHGPYWYAYWREGAKLRSGYIGKTQPEGVTAIMAQRAEQRLTTNRAAVAMPVAVEAR